MRSDSRIARIKPAALQPGDIVGIVAPASDIKRESLEAGCEALRKLGYKPFYFDSIFDRDLFFAGSVQRRARELEQMFLRDEVRAVLCARGGYGSNYLLDVLNLEKIKAHPKIFVGYSDITALLTYFADVAGFTTFHGPMVTKDFAEWIWHRGNPLSTGFLSGHCSRTQKRKPWLRVPQKEFYTAAVYRSW